MLFLYRLSNIDAKIHGSISFIPCNKASKNILRIKNDLNFCKAKKHLWKNLNISFMLFSQSYYKFNKQHQKINISATPYVYCLVSTDIKKPTWKNRITGTVHVRLKCNNLLLRCGKQFFSLKKLNHTIILSVLPWQYSKPPMSCMCYPLSVILPDSFNRKCAYPR